MIDHALARGRLVTVHRAVYAVGHTALPPLARELGAVFACGEGALLSHASAAAVWGLRPAREQDHVDVTVVGVDRARRRPEIRVHRVADLDRLDRRRFEGMPITSPARTLLDLAAALEKGELERAVDEAIVRQLVSRRALRAVLSRYPRRRGASALAPFALPSRTTALTRSEGEERFLGLVRRARLPRPEVNVPLGRYTADFLWREQRLVIETDSFTFHSSRAALARDHERDAVLEAAGWTVRRFLRQQLVDEPEVVVARVATALAAHRAVG